MQWKKSAQYENMPHEQYMQTAEGKRSQQAFQQWGQWMQNSIPTPSKPGTGSPGGITNRYDGAGFAANGTPIAGDPRMRGQQPASSGGNFSAYSPGQAQPQQNPYGTATPYGVQRPLVQQPAPPQQYEVPRPSDYGVDFSVGGDGQIRDMRYRQPPAGSPGPSQPGRYMPPPGGQPPIGPGLIDPNVANNPYANRPPPFQATTQNLDGTQSELPNYQQRDAFISQINNQLGQMQNQSWQQPGMGAPQFNFPQMLGQAGEMAQQGFQNPFAQAGQGLLGTLQQQSTPSMYNQQPAGMPQQSGRLVSQEAWESMYPGVPYQPPRPPQQGGISALSIGIGPSVTYAQPGGGVGHTPPPFISHDSDGDGVDDRVQPGPGQPPRVFPGTAQPIPPQSPGTPPSRPMTQPSVLKLAPQADPNLTPSQKAEKFLAANQEAIKRGTFRHSDIDALGLSGPEARLLKNKATVQGRSWERLRKADETARLFPQLERGLNQLYAGYGRR